MTSPTNGSTNDSLAGTIRGADPYRLPHTITPTRYTLRLEPDLAAAAFDGRVLIDLTVHEPADEIVLNAIELPENPDALILPAHASSGKPSIGVDKLPDSAQMHKKG